jgi:hypothetical protein
VMRRFLPSVDLDRRGGLIGFNKLSDCKRVSRFEMTETEAITFNERVDRFILDMN